MLAATNFDSSREKGKDSIAIFTSDCAAQAIPLALLLQG
jgi:hypothetical protein